MRKELRERAEAYATDSMNDPIRTVYFTQNKYNTYGRDAKKRYYFKYAVTHTLAAAFATQKELDEYLRERGF